MNTNICDSCPHVICSMFQIFSFVYAILILTRINKLDESKFNDECCVRNSHICVDNDANVVRQSVYIILFVSFITLTMLYITGKTTLQLKESLKNTINAFRILRGRLQEYENEEGDNNDNEEIINIQ